VLATSTDAEIGFGTEMDDPPATGQEIARGRGPSFYWCGLYHRERSSHRQCEDRCSESENNPVRDFLFGVHFFLFLCIEATLRGATKYLLLQMR
jgi:hypothetical protein